MKEKISIIIKLIAFVALQIAILVFSNYYYELDIEKEKDYIEQKIKYQDTELILDLYDQPDISKLDLSDLKFD